MNIKSISKDNNWLHSHRELQMESTLFVHEKIYDEKYIEWNQ